MDKVNILLVDDHLAKLLSYQTLLAPLGENLLLAKSGREALQVLLKEDVALLLLDVVMPEMDGFELATMIREHPRLEHTPIIFVTSYGESDLDKLKGYELGAVDFVFAPVVPTILLAKVSVFVELHRKRRELHELNRTLEQRVADRTAELERAQNELEIDRACLRRQNVELEAVYQAAPVGLCLLNRQRRVLKMNERMAGINSSAAPASMGQPNHELVSEVADQVGPMLEQVFATGQPLFDIEVRGRTAGSNGEKRCWLCSFAPMLDADGIVESVQFIVLDVTEPKRAEEALAAEQNLLRLVIDTVPHSIFAKDTDGRFIFLNRAVADINGTTPEQMVGHTDIEIAQDKAQAEAIHRDDMAVLKSGVPKFIPEEPLTDTAGRTRILQTVKVPFVVPRTGLRAIIGVSVDITESKRLYREAQEESRRKDEFLAMLAHELRNPLAAISAAVLLTHLHQISDPSLQGARDVIERQTDHMTRLLDELLDISRVTRGKIELRKETLDIRQVLARAIEATRHQIEGREQQLSLDLPSESLWVEADPTRMEQVFTNLLNNAAKYTEPGGRIWISATRDGNEAVLRVSDTGAGLDPVMLGHIFELFMQVPQPLARTQGGLGIGLSMVRSLVEMHGGTVTATSPGIGRGSEFVVRLPLAGASGDAIERPAETTPVAARGIVLVEDNGDSRLMLGELLRLSGHNVWEAADGLQGMELILRHRPDVALVDIGLPGLDGYQVAQKVRAEPIANGIVLVALTGYGQPEDRRRALAAGFDAHLVKPVKLQDLARVLGDIDATSAAT